MAKESQALDVLEIIKDKEPLTFSALVREVKDKMTREEFADVMKVLLELDFITNVGGVIELGGRRL